MYNITYIYNLQQYFRMCTTEINGTFTATAPL